MQLVASGKPAAVVPVEYQKTKITLYKGEDALAARREVASKLTHRMLTALQRKRNVNDEPDWAPMQMLFDADLSYDPFSGMPVFDPSACAPALLKALWRGFCGVPPPRLPLPSWLPSTRGCCTRTTMARERRWPFFGMGSRVL